MSIAAGIFCTRLFKGLALIAGMTALACCQAPQVGSGLPEPVQTRAVEPGPLPEAQGEILGTGPVRVALLLPLTAPGNAAVIAKELKNSAAMAIEDSAGSALHLVVKDTRGTPSGAVDAASAAVAERATLVLGPVFASGVTAAAGILQANQTMMIAYSTDTSVAAPGAYLASYLPEAIIDRTVAYAANAGHRRIVALLPNGAIGTVAENQLRQTLARHGGELVAVARYEYSDASVEAAIAEAAPAIANADAIFIPDGGNTPVAMLNTMQRRGVPLEGKKILGTGQWASADLSHPALQGAWLADADNASLASFRTKYQARFNETPSAVAPVAYDSVALAAGLARKAGGATLTRNLIEDPTGFTGYTGLFRFRSDGTNERGLAIYEVRGGQLQLVEPAPASFHGGS